MNFNELVHMKKNIDNIISFFYVSKGLEVPRGISEIIENFHNFMRSHPDPGFGSPNLLTKIVPSDIYHASKNIRGLYDYYTNLLTKGQTIH